VRFNKMSPNDPISSMVMSSVAVGALKDNPLYNTLLVLQRDLKDVECNELDKCVVN